MPVDQVVIPDMRGLYEVAMRALEYSETFSDRSSKSSAAALADTCRSGFS